jgi:hypothetical protein
MTANDTLVLNANLETLRTPISTDGSRDLDRLAATAAKFKESRYLDTRPVQHMTATWGN